VAAEEQQRAGGAAKPGRVNTVPLAAARRLWHDQNMFRLNLILFFVLPILAQADEIHVGARLLCKDGAALVQFTTAYNDAPGFPEITGELAREFADATEMPGLDCDTGGTDRPRPVRIKIGNTESQDFLAEVLSQSMPWWRYRPYRRGRILGFDPLALWLPRRVE
jgi:hypothetical protein